MCIRPGSILLALLLFYLMERGVTVIFMKKLNRLNQNKKLRE